MSAMQLTLPSEQVTPAWELFLGESAKRGALFRRGGLNMMTFSHQDSDVDEAVRAARGAFQVMRAAGFTADGSTDPTDKRGQQMGPWVGPR